MQKTIRLGSVGNELALIGPQGGGRARFEQGKEMGGVKRPGIKFLFLFVHCFANIYNGMRVLEA